jgi:DNA-binding protein HU-beta
MNKADLINAIAVGAGITKVAAKQAIDAFVNSATAALKEGDRVALIGFGTFSIAKRSARTGRNPKTQQVLQIAEKNVVRFRPGSELADLVK